MTTTITKHEYLVALAAQEEAGLSATVAMPLADAYEIIVRQQAALEEAEAVLALARMYPQVLVQAAAAEQAEQQEQQQQASAPQAAPPAEPYEPSQQLYL